MSLYSISQAKEEVEAFVNDFFENGCNDQTFDEYFTDDARVNYAGILVRVQKLLFCSRVNGC